MACTRFTLPTMHYGSLSMITGWLFFCCCVFVCFLFLFFCCCCFFYPYSVVSLEDTLSITASQPRTRLVVDYDAAS